MKFVTLDYTDSRIVLGDDGKSYSSKTEGPLVTLTSGGGVILFEDSFLGSEKNGRRGALDQGPGIHCSFQHSKWTVTNRSYHHFFVESHERGLALFQNLKFTEMNDVSRDTDIDEFVSRGRSTHPYLTAKAGLICIPPGHSYADKGNPYESCLRINADYLRSYVFPTGKRRHEVIQIAKASLVEEAKNLMAEKIILNFSGMDSLLVLLAILEAKEQQVISPTLVVHHVDISEWGERAFWSKGSGTWQKLFVKKMLGRLDPNSFEYLETVPGPKNIYPQRFIDRMHFLGVSFRYPAEDMEFHASFSTLYSSIAPPVLVLEGKDPLHQAFNGTGELALFWPLSELFGVFRRLTFGKFGAFATFLFYAVTERSSSSSELLARTAAAQLLPKSRGTYTTKWINLRVDKDPSIESHLRLYRFLADQWLLENSAKDVVAFVSFVQDVTYCQALAKEKQVLVPEGYRFSPLSPMAASVAFSIAYQGFFQMLLPKISVRQLLKEFDFPVLRTLRECRPPKGFRWRQGFRMIDEIFGRLSPLRPLHQIYKEMKAKVGTNS